MSLSVCCRRFSKGNYKKPLVCENKDKIKSTLLYSVKINLLKTFVTQFRHPHEPSGAVASWLSKFWTCALWVMQCALWVMQCALWVMHIRSKNSCFNLPFRRDVAFKFQRHRRRNFLSVTIQNRLPFFTRPVYPEFELQRFSTAPVFAFR